MTIQDRNFDDLAKRLKDRVYGSTKGRLRLRLLNDDLFDTIAELSDVISQGKALDILDAGGGFGQLSLSLAQMGHRVTLCDISEQMLKEAEIIAAEKNVLDRVTFIHGSFQALPETFLNRFDIVLNHAVLEWIGDIEKGITLLSSYLKPGGYLSVMFYNLDALIMHNVIKGNFYKVMNDAFKGDPNGLTPSNPVRPMDVEKYISSAGLSIVLKSGIRCFHDYMQQKAKNSRSYEDMLALERKYYRTEPFASMGRYVHLICKK